MMVFQHAYVVVSYCNLIIHTDQKDIADSRMLVIVQRRTNVATHLLQIVKPNSIFDTSVNGEVVESLADVGRMRLVMICDLFVPSGKAPHEAH